VKIREMTDGDAASVVPLLLELGYSVEPAAIPARIAAIRRERGDVFVAVGGDGKTLGVIALMKLAVLHAAGPVGMITALVVSSRARGQGVGRQLVDRAKEWAKREACVRLIVTSGEQRADAHAFYPACGLRYTGRRFAVTLEP
jgi:GNAT superfamily N-acetyltransferase